MKFALPLLIVILASGCVKKNKIKFEAIHIIERDTDILSEEDIEELPEAK